MLGGLDGGGGNNTINGLNNPTSWAVTATDAGYVSIGQPLEFDGTTVANNRITFANPHGLETGQAVLYGHGAGGQDVNGLVDGNRYYVIKVSDTIIELSDNQGQGATGNMLNPAPAGTRHTITPVVGFTQVMHLNGGAGPDVFDLQVDGSLTGSISGGGGTNLLRVAGRSTAAVTIWTINGANAGQVQSRTDQPGGDPVLDPLITGGFTGIGSLLGGTLDDAFVFDPTGNITGSVEGGGGANSLQVKFDPNAQVQAADERIWAITGANAGWTADRSRAFLVTGVDLDPNGTFTDVAVNAAQRTITLPGKNFSTGQAVVYRAGSNELVGGLVSNQVYYIIADLNTPDAYKLATTLENAFLGEGIVLAGPAGGSQHSLTSVLGFGSIANLSGDRQPDTFGLFNGGRLTGTIDGGPGGQNTLPGPHVDTNWAINDLDRGSVTNPAGDVVYVNAFHRVGHLFGGTANDRFTLLGNGLLTGSITGGPGSTRFRGRIAM